MFVVNDLSIWFWIVAFISIPVLSTLTAAVITFLEKRGIMYYKRRLFGEKKSFFKSWPFVRNASAIALCPEGGAIKNPKRETVRSTGASAPPSPYHESKIIISRDSSSAMWRLWV
jgi:hypothetical protein